MGLLAPYRIKALILLSLSYRARCRSHSTGHANPRGGQFPPWEPRPLRQAIPKQLQVELNSTHEIQLGVDSLVK
jgi:hypothetical protein